MKEKLECEESDEVVKRCQKWKEDLETRFPKRKVRVRGDDENEDIQ